MACSVFRSTMTRSVAHHHQTDLLLRNTYRHSCVHQSFASSSCTRWRILPALPPRDSPSPRTLCGPQIRIILNPLNGFPFVHGHPQEVRSAVDQKEPESNWDRGNKERRRPPRCKICRPWDTSPMWTLPRRVMPRPVLLRRSIPVRFSPKPISVIVPALDVVAQYLWTDSDLTTLRMIASHGIMET